MCKLRLGRNRLVDAQKSRRARHAAADPRPQSHLGLLFRLVTHVGVAGWYGYPIVPDGFIPKINDAFFIEAGAAVERFGYSFAACDENWWRISPMGGVRYQIYLTDDWTAFVTSKAGWGAGFSHSSNCGLTEGSVSQFAWDSSIGAYWNFSSNWHLRLEFGYFGINPGIGMQL